MKIKGLLLAAMAFLALGASAQDWTSDAYTYGQRYEGYVIDKGGTKIEGFIQYTNQASLQDNIIFFHEKDNNKTKVKYKPADLLEYMVADKLYHCITYSGGISGKTIKGNLLISDGCIKEYRWYNKSTNPVYKTTEESDEEFNRRKFPPVTVYWKEGVERPRSDDYFLLKYAKKIQEFISDNAELAAKVTDKEKGYGFINISRVIEEYNTACAQ